MRHASKCLPTKDIHYSIIYKKKLEEIFQSNREMIEKTTVSYVLEH